MKTQLLNVLSSLFLVLQALAAQTANYPVQPLIPPPTVIQQISDTADSLVKGYGSRPPYTGVKFAVGASLTQDEATLAAPYILACESRNRDVGCIMDSNHKLSCGRGQFQDWPSWENESGITGDPNNGSTSISMLVWGLENGYIGRWSCARIEQILTN